MSFEASTSTPDVPPDAPPEPDPFEPEPEPAPDAPAPEPEPPEPDRDSEARLNGETPHEQARRLIGRALSKNLGVSFDVLRLRLRQGYARTLTPAERMAALVYLDEQHEAARAMLTADEGGSVEFEWPDNDAVE